MALNPLIKSYLKDFVKTFLILILTLSTFLAVVGLLEKIHDYLPYRPSTTFFIEFILLSIPRYIFYLIPFVTLISSLFIFSMGIRNRELIVVSLAGGRLSRSLLPFLILSFLISLFGFILSEFIQPEFTGRLNRLIQELTEKGKNVQKSNLFLRTKEGTIVKIETLKYSGSSDRGSIGNNLKIFILKEGSLKERFDAEQAEIFGNQWTLKNVVHYDFVSAQVRRIETYRIEIDVNLSAATIKDIRQLDEFSIRELIGKREELRRMGLSNPKVDADLSGRLSYNLVTVFMMILGISIPLGAHERFSFILTKFKGSQTRGGAIIIGIGFIVMILYWVVYSFFMFLGYSKIIPPLVAPWITPLIFGVISVKLWLSIKE